MRVRLILLLAFCSLHFASLSFAQEEPQVSEQGLRSAVQAAEKQHGPESKELLKPLYALADFYTKNLKPSEAVAVWERVLPIEEREYGPEHPEVASTLQLRNPAQGYGPVRQGGAAVCEIAGNL